MRYALTVFRMPLPGCICRAPFVASAASVFVVTRRVCRCDASAVFGPEASQADLYAGVVDPLVRSTLAGVNAALIAVGGAGAGKTHSVYGSEVLRTDPLAQPRAEWGVALWACEQLLRRPARGSSLAAQLAAAADAAGGEGNVGSVRVLASFVELDGERVLDLLAGVTHKKQMSDAYETNERYIRNK